MTRPTPLLLTSSGRRSRCGRRLLEGERDARALNSSSDSPPGGVAWRVSMSSVSAIGPVVPLAQAALVERAARSRPERAQHAADDRGGLARADERARDDHADAQVHLLDLLGEQVGLVAADVHQRDVEVAAAAEAAEVRLRHAVAHEVERERPGRPGTSSHCSRCHPGCPPACGKRRRLPRITSVAPDGSTDPATGVTPANTGNAGGGRIALPMRVRRFLRIVQHDRPYGLDEFIPPGSAPALLCSCASRSSGATRRARAASACASRSSRWARSS